MSNHLTHIKTYFTRHFADKHFSSPVELQKYIARQPKGLSNIIKTARVYLNYCEQYEKMPLDVIERYRSFLKIKRSQPDVFVPGNEAVIENYARIKHNSSLGLIYLILATSGIRYIECLDFLRDYDKSKFIVHPGFVAYKVAYLRHTKNINNIYLPSFVYEKLHHMTENYDLLRKRFNDSGCNFSFKYLRKWHYNFLLYNNVPESVADFIQGRSSKSIGANHYLAKSQQAIFWYEKVCPRLKHLFTHNKNISENSAVHSRESAVRYLNKDLDYSGGETHESNYKI